MKNLRYRRTASGQIIPYGTCFVKHFCLSKQHEKISPSSHKKREEGGKLFQTVGSSVAAVKLLIAAAAGTGGAKHLVGIAVVIVHIDDAAGNARAVVTGTLQRVNQIGPDKAGLDAAAALLKPQDMPGTKLVLQFLTQEMAVLGIGNKEAYQLFKESAAGQQNAGADDIEEGMADGNTQVSGTLFQNSRGEDPIDHQIKCQTNGGTNYIEQQVNKGCALGVLIGAEAGDDGSDTRTDVLAHDNGHSSCCSEAPDLHPYFL